MCAGDGDAHADYLQPFITSAKVGDPSSLTEKEAKKVDKECRAAHKERLLERVAIIQRRLDDENERLLRRQQAFSRSRDHDRDAELEFEQYCSDATFRIGILEQRLARQEGIATRRYQELESRLVSDPRLAALRKSSSAGGGGAGGGTGKLGGALQRAFGRPGGR